MDVITPGTVIGYKKIITWFLISLLISQEIFRIPYSLSSAKAFEIDNHENIVSLVVEEQLFKKIQGDVEKYALRVQSVLPRTRTVILTFSENTHPVLIASANERLYYSGLPNHGNKTQKLVGTILIGNIPLPTVHKESTSFLSIFPYIDFDEPNFVWNWDKNVYEYLGVDRKNPRPELWHSVIAPHTGDLEQDTIKIKDFFARVYRYDNKQAEYADLGKDPQVLYADSVRDSRATAPRSLAAYEQLFVPQQEHFQYNRYTREFAQYLYENYITLMNGSAATIKSFSEWRPSNNTQNLRAPLTLDSINEASLGSGSFLANASDISTRIFARELIPSFVKTLSEKYIGDIARWVHQSGRYYDGYSKVRIDTVPELIQERDVISARMLQEANDAFEKVINDYIEGSLSLDIPVLVSRTKGARSNDFTYTNYFLGKKASDLQNASECSILRGSNFGPTNTVAEMNHGYYIQSIETDADLIAQDGEDRIRCDDRVTSYWGGNTPMNLEFTSGLATLKTHKYHDFPRSIYDPAGGKKTIGQSSPFDCLKTDLILEPYVKRVPLARGFREYAWPKETEGTRYSCATNFTNKTEYFDLDPTPESNENIFQTLTSCQGSGNVTLLARGGNVAARCSSSGAGGIYKLTSSLIKHVSPDTETYGKQLTSLATPNLPVDENRYVVYVNRKIEEKRFDYPNVFDIQIPIDATDEAIKQKIQQYLRGFDEKLKPEENLTSLGVFSQLIPSSGTKNPISLATLIASSPDLENNLIASLRWKNLPTAMKYQQGILDALKGDKAPNVAMFGDPEREYEIAYMGGQGDAKNFILGYHPGSNAEYPTWYQTIVDNQEAYEEIHETSSEPPQDPFTLSSEEYDKLFGTDTGSSSQEEKNVGSESCNYDNAVVIWEWPSAIQCWLKNLFNTEWEPGESDFSFDWKPYLSLSLGGRTLYSTEDTISLPQSDNNSNDIIDSIEESPSSFVLRNIPSSYVLEPKSSITLRTYLEKGNSIAQDNISQIDLIPLRIANLDTGKVFTPTDPQWETIRKDSLSIAGSSVLTNGSAAWTLRSLTDARMSFEFATRVQSDNKIYITSSQFTLTPESKFPLFTLLSSDNTLTPKTVRADDTQGVTILFASENVPAEVDVDIMEYTTNKNVLSLRSVPVTEKILKLGSPAADTVLHKAGKYIITLTSNGVSAKTDLFITAGAPKNLVMDIPKIVLVGEKYATDFSLTDTWGNSISTDSWTATIRTSQPVISGENKEPKQDFTVPLSQKFQFQPMRENTITFDIWAKHNQEDIQQSIIVTALSDIQIASNITHTGVIRVGQKLPVEFIVTTKQGTPITNWDVPIRIGNKGTAAHLENSLVTFSGGKGTATLVTGIQSGKTSFYFSDTLTGKKIGSDVEIAPDIPSRLTFSGPEILLARRGQSQVLSVNIFDKYGNYIHPSTVDVRIESDATDLLEPLGNIGKIEGDTYGVRLVSRGYPGRVLLRGALWENGVKSNKTALENVWQVQILPVIASEDVVKNTWNALTHVLLGGPFGQFVTSGYFAGSLLYSPDTQALSVSTLVDTPRAGLFSVASSGAINLLSAPHLGMGIEAKYRPDSVGLFALMVSDKRLGEIAKITYPRLTDADRILFSPSSTDTVVTDNILFYKGSPLTSIHTIFESPVVSFTLLPSTSDIRLGVSYQNKNIGLLTIAYAPRTPSISGISPSTYSLEMLMSDIVTDSTWGTLSSSDVRGVMVLESAAVASSTGGPVEDGYSAYPEQYGMGWTGTNLGLLQFASGESFAQTQQAFADYVTINLGDALVKLPEYKVDSTTGFDTTIGVPVFIGSEPISDFTFSDVNNDQQKDILVTDTTNTLSVALSKKDGTYLDRGEFLSFENAREGSIRTGDFFGDGFADAVYVDNGGIVHLISHDAEGSQEIDIISDRNRDMGQVTQIEVFDMDHDEYDDIIILDTLGQLSVFYGTHNKRFIYQFVDHVFDFVFAEKSLFSGAVYYEYPGFTFPDFTLTREPLLRSQQEQIQSVLFTPVTIPDNLPVPQNTTPSSSSLGTQMAQSFAVDINAGAGTSLSDITNEYNSLAGQYGSAVRVSPGARSNKSLSLLKAPFIDKNILSISKKFSSLEKEGLVIQGALIQGVITLKNTSAKQLSKLVIAEKFPSYLEGPITKYSLKRGGAVTERIFIDSPEGGIVDLRDITLAPGETIDLTYTAKLAAFSFGTFDVGYLEDDQDPLMNIEVPKDKILTIHTTAKNLNTIPERDFHGAEKYGDIRINPNNTCGGPLFLWRSHNVFDRTYQKTLIVRNIPDPDTENMDISNNPLDSDGSLSSSTSQDIASALSRDSSPAAVRDMATRYADTAENELRTYNKDSDGDEIPDRYDEDTGDIFTIQNSGNSTQITLGLGKLDEALDSAIQGVETFMSGLSCGFGDAGCLAQPMNWTANVPGNTITALGYAIPGINRAPLACHKDVRCGIPIFSFPTASYPYFWPPNPDEGGGAFDIGAGSGSSIVSQNTTFTGGYGTSQFRLFIGATLTGALTEVLCFGPNNLANPIINLPAIFPVAFQGNCIYATQSLMQCSDDGSGDIVTELEMDVSSGYEPDDFQLTDGDSCGFFNPVTAYPDALVQAVNAYIQNPTPANLDLLRVQISENASLVTGSYESDASLLFASSSPYAGIQSSSPNSSISYPQTGSGTGIIKISLDSTSFDVTQTGPILNINLKSISAFPRFIMDWYHRQLDEIVSSFGSLPDIKIFLPDLGSGFADGGWIPEFNNSNTGASSPPVSDLNTSVASDALTPFDVATSARDDLVSGIQGGIGGIQSAFEYLSLLPMVDVHPEMISLHLPWMDRSAMQSWIYRNEAILAQWEALPQNALGNAVNAGDLISSIRSNIETVRTYMTLPEQLQNLFYLKEKFLYEILKNVQAIQQLMGGWLYDNGERFKTWVETFILITKLWDLWQVLIDIFDDYEESCAVCHNEQWNLQEWLWIVISAVIPPIPVIKMPRWPDIELDFSNIDLGIDIAYPVFNFSFYPLSLPDMPSPSFSGINLGPIPQLPPLPDLNLDFEIPAIQLPKLPNLPPAPLIPELSQSISVVLKIFKIVTLIQCLYRKVPLSPEWYVGTKIAHKTDRQGYLPIDFLNVQMPSAVIKWVDAIRVSTEVNLTYDVNFIIEMIESALEPLSEFPKDLSNYTGDLPSSVSIDLDSDNGSTIQTSSLDQLPGLIGQLYEQATQPKSANTSDEIQALSKILAHNLPEKTRVSPYEVFDPDTYYGRFQEQATRISDAIQKDIDTNKVFIADLADLSGGKKKPEDIAWLQDMNPAISHLAASPVVTTGSALIDVVTTLKDISQTPQVKGETSRLATAALPLAVTPSATTDGTATISPTTMVTTKTQNSTQLKKSKGLYITKNGTSKRLNYFYEDPTGESQLHMIDDDGDGDRDIFYILGNTLYRKENHTQSRNDIYINDLPQIFTVTTMMREFFGQNSSDIGSLPHDMQIFLRDSHSAGSIEAQYLIHKKTSHEQFDIFSTWGQSDPRRADYRVDSIMAPQNIVANGYALPRHPMLSSVAGQVTLYRKKIYRTLFPGGKYTQDTTTLQNLPTDFVIRAKKIAYTQEGTKLELSFGNKKQDISLRPGDVLYFAQDSTIVLKSGSLILPSDDYEQQILERSDINTPLFPDDILKTSSNGTALVEFPDGSRTNVFPDQTWSLVYHSGVQKKIQEFTLPVTPGWYYVLAHDAFSTPENRIPQATLFDTYSEGEEGQLVDTLPTTLNLNFDTPTEIDFQQYFPLDTIAKVEVTGLPTSFWNQVTATKILFQTSQKDQSMTLRVTSKRGVVYIYTINLVTQPATLAIKQVDTKKSLTGTISTDTALPLTIQSFINGRSWTLSSPLRVEDRAFTTSFAGISPEWSVTYGGQKVFSVKRDTGSPLFEPGLTLVPDIKAGSPLVMKVLLSQKEIAQIVYQAQNLLFQQAASRDMLQKNTLGLVSTSLRLEPALAGDTYLKGGAYIVDAKYSPLMIFDASGVVRYLDSGLKFSAQYEGDALILTISRGTSEVGKLVLTGEMLTVWDE